MDHPSQNFFGKSTNKLLDKVVDKIFGLTDRFNPRTTLIASLILLICTSLLMIASASIPFASAKGYAEPLRFFWLQLGYVAIGVMVAITIYKIPIKYYYKQHFHFILTMWATVLILLILTKLIGEEINGSTRWLSLGPFNLQTAELAKAVMVFVTADYVVRRSAEIRSNIYTGARLLIWYLPVVFFLIAQPDFGSVVVMAATLLVMVYVGGAQGKQYLAPAIVLLSTMGIAAIAEPYRRERILSLVGNPFDDVQGRNYQLVRSLIAYGRGRLTGTGYGDSIQKLAQLPEAHTDFLLAVTGEELGFIGVVFVLLLEAVIVLSIMAISLQALKRRQLRLSYTVFGFAIIIFGQVVINAGMTMGLLPTKGLTMPFFSYGGSSLVVLLMMIGFVLKVENQSPIIDAKRQNDKY